MAFRKSQRENNFLTYSVNLEDKNNYRSQHVGIEVGEILNWNREEFLQYLLQAFNVKRAEHLEWTITYTDMQNNYNINIYDEATYEHYIKAPPIKHNVEIITLRKKQLVGNGKDANGCFIKNGRLTVMEEMRKMNYEIKRLNNNIYELETKMEDMKIEDSIKSNRNFIILREILEHVKENEAQKILPSTKNISTNTPSPMYIHNPCPMKIGGNVLLDMEMPMIHKPRTPSASIAMREKMIKRLSGLKNMSSISTLGKNIVNEEIKVDAETDESSYSSDEDSDTSSNEDSDSSLNEDSDTSSNEEMLDTQEVEETFGDDFTKDNLNTSSEDETEMGLMDEMSSAEDEKEFDEMDEQANAEDEKELDEMDEQSSVEGEKELNEMDEQSSTNDEKELNEMDEQSSTNDEKELNEMDEQSSANDESLCCTNCEFEMSHFEECNKEIHVDKKELQSEDVKSLTSESSAENIESEKDNSPTKRFLVSNQSEESLRNKRAFVRFRRLECNKSAWYSMGNSSFGLTPNLDAYKLRSDHSKKDPILTDERFLGKKDFLTQLKSDENKLEELKNTPARRLAESQSHECKYNCDLPQIVLIGEESKRMTKRPPLTLDESESDNLQNLPLPNVKEPEELSSSEEYVFVEKNFSTSTINFLQ